MNAIDTLATQFADTCKKVQELDGLVEEAIESATLVTAATLKRMGYSREDIKNIPRTYPEGYAKPKYLLANVRKYAGTRTVGAENKKRISRK